MMVKLIKLFHRSLVQHMHYARSRHLPYVRIFSLDPSAVLWLYTYTAGWSMKNLTPEMLVVRGIVNYMHFL